MSEKFTEFGLSTDSYAAFDAVTLKALIKDRLSETGVFTDHVFEGSNLSSIIDIVAYSYHTLLFYLNRTSSESIFTEAQLYENVNRIVKLLNYNPSGYKTSVLTFNAKGKMDPGSYTIPRYSFIDVGGVKFSTNTDISFGKNLSVEEPIPSIGETYLLYQGSFEEYPSQTAIGEAFETVTLSIDKDIKPDAFNIHVYVKSNDNKWREYSLTESLFLETPTSYSFEKRLNENMLYEIRFGNNVYGRQLQSGDEIAIYYLKSDKDKGVIGANAMDGKLSQLTTSKFLQIRADIKPVNVSYISLTDLQDLTLTNSDPSTKPEDEESVSHIKTYAPRFFESQNRLITSSDYENHIRKNFGNVVLSTKVVSNDEYINGHLAYYTDVLNLQNPNLESRLLYNQVNFASSTNFNNIYIYAVPKFEKPSTATPMVNFLSPAQRNLIVNSMNNLKIMTAEPVIIDPVYMAVDFGAATPAEKLKYTMRETTKLNVVKRKDSQRDSDTIKEEIVNIIKSYFGTNISLQYLFDINAMYSDLSNVKDIIEIYMTRDDNPGVRAEGITFLTWNPSYENSDISIVSQNKLYKYFQCPYLFDTSNLINKINVITSGTGTV